MGAGQRIIANNWSCIWKEKGLLVTFQRDQSHLHINIFISDPKQGEELHSQLMLNGETFVTNQMRNKTKFKKSLQIA